MMQSGSGNEEQQETIEESNQMDEDDDQAANVDTSGDGGDNDDTQGFINLRDPTERPVHKLSVRLLDTYKFINRVSSLNSICKIFEYGSVDRRFIMKLKPKGFVTRKTQQEEEYIMTVMMTRTMITSYKVMKY